MVMTNNFNELNVNEMMEVDGGDVLGAAIALVVAAGGAIKAGFEAGRGLVRDIRDKFFD